MADVELIIKIPEEMYKEYVLAERVFASLGRGNGKSITDNLLRAIKNGTPIPKGHGRLIDADEIQFENSEFDTYSDYSRAFDAIDYAPTVIEAENEVKEVVE